MTGYPVAVKPVVEKVDFEVAIEQGARSGYRSELSLGSGESGPRSVFEPTCSNTMSWSGPYITSFVKTSTSSRGRGR